MRLVFLLGYVLSVYSIQSQTTLNAYAKVTSVTGSSVLALSNVNISNHTFTVGGQVVIMQMQDNVIGTNTTNAVTFGNLSAIASAGLYEIRTIAAVTPTSGTPTSLTLSAALSNAYNINANASVQLISLRDLGASYTTSANITQPTANVTTQTNNGTPGSDNSGGTTNATGGGGSNNGGIIASANGPLPITLVFFKGEAESSTIKLSWQTASEKNNKLFEIEKSADGFNFIKIGTVAGAINSNTLKNYEFIDTEPKIGFDYYRLKQMDVDGTYKYSPIVYLDIDDVFRFSFYPNPITGNETLSIHLDKHPGGAVEVIICDLTGKQFFNRAVMPEHPDQPNEIEIENLNLDSGIYLIKVQSGYTPFIKKLLVK